MLPAVDEPEVVFEPLMLPPPDDLEPRARLPLPEPEVLLPRPLPEVMLPLVLPEVEPIVEPDVLPIVEPDVLPIEVVLPLVLPMVVLPLVEPEVVPVWANAAVEIRPKPRAKAAARSGKETYFFMY